MSNVNGNGVKIPGWAVSLVIVSLIGVGISRADVENLKKEVSTIRPLSESVVVLQTDMDNLKVGMGDLRSSQSEMRGDLKEIQRDIKTILQRGR